MPKNLPPEIIAQIDAQQKRPVYLFELGLTSTLRFAASKTNIVFPLGGNTYVAKAIDITDASQSLEGQIGRIQIKFDNVIRDMAAYAHAEDFRGKTLVIKRVYLDAMGSETYYNEIFNGYMERPNEISAQWLSVTGTTGKPLNHKCLKVSYQRMCPWTFGGYECNTNGHANLSNLTVAGTVDSGTTGFFVDSALTQANYYWNFGRVEIVKDGITYSRKVKEFTVADNTITIDVALPVSIDSTCTYTMWKGCDQTYLTCTHPDDPVDQNWGPENDNSLNFGGCIHISKRQDVGGT